MKCTICDKCKKIIENPKQLRVLTCSKPVKPHGGNPRTFNPTDPMSNDISWSYDLCVRCSEEIERLISPDDDSYEPDGPQPVDPENPGDEEEKENPGDKDPEEDEPGAENEGGNEEGI